MYSLIQQNTQENKTDLGKCTQQCDKTERSNSTQSLPAKNVFFGCKKINNKKEEAKKRIDKELM